MDRTPINNPVYRPYFADPYVFQHQGTFYAVGTERDETYWQANPERVIPLLRSADLSDWTPIGHAVVAIDAIRGGPIWAPEVTPHAGKFYLYYASGKSGFCMRVAVADRPEGPYLDTSTPLTDTRHAPFAIDGHAFQDTDGQWYFYYAADFLDRHDGAHVGTALLVDRLVDMTRLEGNPRTVARARYPWQMFQSNRTMYGQTLDWYTLEGPVVVKRQNKYFCFYSGGNYQNDTYGVDYLTADSPLGPWDCSGGKDGPRVLRTVKNKILGPGHCSVFTRPGPPPQDYIVYHAWDLQMTARQMCIDPLLWTPNGPRCERFLQPTPAAV